MDILKSSNIERVNIFFWSKRTKELMEDLNSNNIFKMSENETKKLQKYFSAVFQMILWNKKNKEFFR